MSNWTEERIALLKKLWAIGDSCSVIGAQIGVTRNAVIGKVMRLGLPLRKTQSDGRPRGQRWRECHRAWLAAPSFVADAPVKAPDHLGLTFDQLKPGLFQYQETPFTYCGQPVEAGKSFCGFHQRLCYHKVDTKARKPFIPARGVA